MMNENMMNENRKSNGVNLQEVFNSVLIFYILHSFFNFPRIFHLYLNTVMKFKKKTQTIIKIKLWYILNAVSIDTKPTIFIRF